MARAKIISDQMLPLGEFLVRVQVKVVRRLRLSILRRERKIMMIVPNTMTVECAMEWAKTQLGWLRATMKKYTANDCIKLAMTNDRSHMILWGKKRDLKIDWRNGAGHYYIADEVIVLQMRSGSSDEYRNSLEHRMMRDEVRRVAEPFIKTWSEFLKVIEPRFGVQMMRTQWGSCNTTTCAIRLNSELCKYDPKCLEYVVVHELCHFIEPYHNDHFYELIATCLPDWEERRDALASYPDRQDNPL